MAILGVRDASDWVVDATRQAFDPTQNVGGVSSVSGAAPITSTGGGTPTIGLTTPLDPAYGGTGAANLNGLVQTDGTHPLTANWPASVVSPGSTPFSITAQNTVAWFNVKSYGAVGNGSTDDTTAINKAIADAAANGSGIVYFPKGIYKITSTINVGNGSAGGVSTYHSIHLLGDGGPTNTSFTNSQRGSVLFWGGAASGVMMNVLGPISGIAIENLFFDAQNTAATCLRTDHMSDSRMRYIFASAFTGHGIIATAYSNPTGFFDGANENFWENIRIESTNVGCVALRVGETADGGGNHLDVAQNVFTGVNIRVTGAPSYGLRLQFCDANFFRDCTVTAGCPIDIVPTTGNLGFPGANVFSGYTGAYTFNIQSSTNASPITITTATTHGLRLGDYVAIANHLVNTAANGVWKITNVGGTTFDLVGSTGNGVGGATGLVQPSGIQEATGTWNVNGTYASGLYLNGLNPEGWYYFPNVMPPLAIRGLKGTMQGGGQFGCELIVNGTARPLVFSQNVNAATIPGPNAPAPVYPYPAFQFLGADGNATGIWFDSFSSTGTNRIDFRRARGTIAVPSAVQVSDILGSLQYYGYGATGYSASARTGFYSGAAENWTDSAQGTTIQMNATLAGGTTAWNPFFASGAGKVGINTTNPSSTLTVNGTIELVNGSGGVIKFADGSTQATAVGVGGAAPSSRLISTTAPLSGGGDLTADRTLSVAITPSSNGGAVALQASTPGTQQTGNINLSGTVQVGATPSIAFPFTLRVDQNATTGSHVENANAGTTALTQIDLQSDVANTDLENYSSAYTGTGARQSRAGGLITNANNTSGLSIAAQAGDIRLYTGGIAAANVRFKVPGAAANGNDSIVQAQAGTFYPVPGVIFQQTADKVTTANTLTTLFATGVGSLTLPANFLIVGRTIRIRMGGYISVADGAVGTKTLTLTLGGTTIATGTSISTMQTILNNPWSTEALITCRTIGAPGTVQAWAEWNTGLAASSARYGVMAAATAATNITTTGALVIDLQYNNGNATGTATTTTALVEFF
jgi:hypothetical protein